MRTLLIFSACLLIFPSAAYSRQKQQATEEASWGVAMETSKKPTSNDWLRSIPNSGQYRIVMIRVCNLGFRDIEDNGKNYLIPYQGNYTPDLVRRPPSCGQTFQAKPCLGVVGCQKHIPRP